MAILFLDETLRRDYKKEFDLAIKNLQIRSIEKLEKGILKIHFISKKYDDLEPVIAKLDYNQNGKAIITFKDKLIRNR
jgi:hypothetical protein